MPRWLEILLTLVLFAIGMAALSWAVNATLPAGVDWLWDRIGGVAVWVGIITFWIIGGFFAWKGHRPTKGSAGR
ncbi:hypothetical protein MKK69_10400 [Methylobacterium sp. J-026]|uniref:hypothetical protein n=1 Tax=Methylobacterium sp. J-026 TaxID=2836624 RepID=UPI001FBB0E09|nr:hypothetical protein [Methylobacterium sp. J-026]MCJ2134457.1 hypothetical protein [Methylobacterium sp. J-026]